MINYVSCSKYGHLKSPTTIFRGLLLYVCWFLRIKLPNLDMGYQVGNYCTENNLCYIKERNLNTKYIKVD